MTTALACVLSFFAEKFDSKDRGATAVEYGLMVGLIAVVIIGAVAFLGQDLNGMFQAIVTALPGGNP